MSFLIVTGTMRWFSKNKMLFSIDALSSEKKKKFISTYKSVVKMHKLVLLLMPICLVVVPYTVHVYQPERFFHVFVLIVMAYVLCIDDFLFRRSILNKILET